MNINKWNGKKKVFALFGVILVIVGIIVTIFLVQRQQETRSHAQKSTTIVLSPPNQNVAPSEDANLDVTLNPGTNQVNFVKFVIKFDPAKIDTNLVVFNVNPSSSLKTLSSPQFTIDGTYTVTLGVGSDPTKVVTSPIKLGTILIPVKSGASSGTTQITFDESGTQVRSINSADAFNENVLSGTTPANITIAAICVPNVSTCSWDPTDGVSTYHYVITDVDTNQIISEDDSSDTSVDFNSLPGKTYKCEVTAVNSCQEEGEAGEGISTCPVPSLSPTPSTSPTPGPSGTPTPTSGPSSTPTPTTKLTPTPTPTPTKVPGSSPTPTPTSTTPPVTATPTPTTIIGSSPTPTTEIASSPTPTSEILAVSPTPSLPPTGSPFVVAGIIGGLFILLGGLILLIL